MATLSVFSRFTTFLIREPFRKAQQIPGDHAESKAAEDCRSPKPRGIRSSPKISVALEGSFQETGLQTPNEERCNRASEVAQTAPDLSGLYRRLPTCGCSNFKDVPVPTIDQPSCCGVGFAHDWPATLSRRHRAGALVSVFRSSIRAGLLAFLCFLSLYPNAFAANTPPRITNLGITSPTNEGAWVNLIGNIVDPNRTNKFVLTVNWGDGTLPSRYNYPTGTTAFSEYHLYADNKPPSDTFTVNLTLGDGAGGTYTTNKTVRITNVAPMLADLTFTSSIEQNAPATLRGTAIQEFTPPTSNSFPNSIVAGPDGALWFTETLGRRVGRITTNGVITEYAVPTGTNLQGITVGPDKALWFCVQDSARIGRITTNGVINQYSLAAGRRPQGITTGPDGALWYSLFWGNKRLGRITTNGVVTENLLQDGATPYGIVTGPDGYLWYTDYFYDWIVRSTTSNVRTNWAIEAFSSPALITVGPDNALWFTVVGGDPIPGKIGRITTNGVLTEIPLGVGTSPHGIGTGPDGAIWFTETGSNRIGRLSLDGGLTRYALPTTSTPLSIASGKDGALWFTEANRNRIGRLAFTSAGNVLLSGTIDDPGFGDSHTMLIDWGDGTPVETVTFGPGIVSFNLTHQYSGAGPSYPVSVTIRDDESAQTSTNLTVTVGRTRLTSVERQTNGNMIIRATAFAGATYSIEASPDFQTWSSIGSATADNTGALQFEDTNTTGAEHRFYRLLRM